MAGIVVACRDIRADLYFSFHRKSRSLDHMHLENSLLGFVHFHVGKRDCAIVSALWIKGKTKIRISSHLSDIDVDVKSQSGFNILL